MTIKASNFPTTRPSLDLNFAQTKRLDPRVTFSRASSGTYTDVDGLIKSAATNVARFDHNPATGESLGLLVEEARTNLITYSEQLDNAGWGKTGGAVTANATTAPDGASTADKFVEDTSNGFHGIAGSGSVTSVAYTYSAYVKPAGRSKFYIAATSSIFGASAVVFDLATLTTSATDGYTARIEVLPNGWYRVSATRVANTSGGATFGMYFYNGSNLTSYTGDGTSGAFIWGAQLEAGSFPTSYIPTPATFTGRSSTATFYDSAGVIQTAASGVARSNAFFPDSNGVMRPAGLLLEAAATNLATQSEAPTNWAFNNATGALDVSVVTPDGTTGSVLVTFATPGSTDARLYTSLVSVTGGTTYTISIWARMQSGTGSFQIGDYVNNILSSSFGLTTSWKRYSFTYTPTTSTHAIYFPINTSGTLLWGAQVEAGSYATSYIPTAGSTVTRAADTSTSATVTRSADVAQITGTNFSSWYNSSEGSVLVSSSTNSSTTGSYLAHFYGASGTQNRIALLRNTSGIGQLISETNGVLQASTTLASGGSIATPSKLAGAYKLNDYYLAQSSIVGADNSGTPDSTINKLSIGSLTSGSSAFANGTISRLTYWPTRLSDATLQAITR